MLSKVYRSIQTLPFDRFITAICDNTLKALIIKDGDEVPDETLIEVWSDLFFDYMEATGDSKFRLKTTLEKDIKVLEGRLTIIDTCLYHLQFFHYPPMVDLLRGDGYSAEDYKLDPADKNQYTEDLNMIKNVSRELDIDRRLLVIELEEMKQSDDKNPQKQATRASFQNILSRIATYKHVAVIRTSEITVSEFAAMLSEYLEYINALKKSTTAKPKR